jgi:type VI secretion system protein ImpI
MALRLTIENVTNLPDGGPTSFTVTSKRSIDIGRDQHLDWTLPDPTRFISGKHCEVHYRNNSYWLHDVSTNGTFLNGSDQRMRNPYQLKSGDRLTIGQYIVAVSIDEAATPVKEPAISGPAPPQHAPYPELWNTDRDAPPPVERHQIMSPREAARPISPDFLDWAAGVPEAERGPTRSRSRARRAEENADMDWASGTPSRAMEPPEPPPPAASPRRPIWTDDEAAASSVSPFGAPRSTSVREAEQPPTRRSSVEGPHTAPSVATNLQADAHEFLRRLARAAALPDDFFAEQDAQQLADQFGELLRITVGSLMALLQARNEAKRLTRSAAQTTIQATENNPLKFAPTPEEAMRILFGPKTMSYLEPGRAFEQGFNDLKSHQLKTYAAMQHAVSALIAEVDPSAIIQDVEGHAGLLDRLRSRKGRFWDAFLMRWKTSFGREKGAAIAAFMLYFADYYDHKDRTGSRY